MIAPQTFINIPTYPNFRMVYTDINQEEVLILSYIRKKEIDGIWYKILLQISSKATTGVMDKFHREAYRLSILYKKPDQEYTKRFPTSFIKDEDQRSEEERLSNEQVS